jgi:predicted lipoprotein with Yx(FWY)xxD motif
VTRPSSRTVRPVLGLASVALLVLATACGDDDDDGASSDSVATTVAPAATEGAAATDAPTTTAMSATTGGDTTLPASDYPVAPGAGTGTTTAGSAAGAGAGATVAVAESSLGEILVDGDGMTLYMFAPDNAGPSTCTDQCLEAWPALPGPATAGAGVDATLLATAARPDDGSAQATCNGWPLYHFVQDGAPGDVNGQGANDVWYVLDATCTPVGME